MLVLSVDCGGSFLPIFSGPFSEIKSGEKRDGIASASSSSSKLCE
tara:strand:+ start:128 stop:262 length:135 start_codon:yes stop_codon:yes gene_type:complete